MKGFLISLVVVVGTFIYAFTHTHELAQDAVDRMKVDEGPMDQAFWNLERQDPVAFAERYRPFVQKRASICKWTAWVGEGDFSISLGRETRERYDDSPLNNEPAYGELLFRWASMEEDLSAGQDAYNAQKRYLELFPSGPHAVESTAAMQRLSMRFNLR